MGIIIFGIVFIIVLAASAAAYIESVHDGYFNDRRHYAIIGTVGALLLLAAGSSLSYWFWNAGLEQSPRGEVQIVMNGEDSRVGEVRYRTRWSMKIGLLNKNMFKTGETELDVSCTDNKNDEAVPVICVRWAVDITTKVEAQELANYIINLNYSNFTKSAVEDRIKDTAEKSYFECGNSDTEIKISDCMLKYSAENIGLPNINIVDVSEV